MVRVLLGIAILIAMSATLIASGLADEPSDRENLNPSN